MKTVIVMVKAPRPGRVKTRLARGIGAVAACWWYRHQVARLLREMQEMEARDARDSARATAPLKPAPDAIVLDTSGMDADAAFRAALQVIESKRATEAPARGPAEQD